MKKLFVGICNSQSMMRSSFFWSFVGINPVCKVELCRSRHPWDVVRNNKLIARFLRSDADYFVKMDVDQVYPPDYFEVTVPLLKDHDVIGPMIYDRWLTSNFMPLCFEEKDSVRVKAFDNKTGIMELPYLHTNCFYNRYVLEALEPPYYEAELDETGLERGNHVDYTFMGKITDAGYKIYINFDMVVRHIADVPVSREVYETWNRGRERVV